jgi:hypothetical protein
VKVKFELTNQAEVEVIAAWAKGIIPRAVLEMRLASLRATPPAPAQKSAVRCA